MIFAQAVKDSSAIRRSIPISDFSIYLFIYLFQSLNLCLFLNEKQTTMKRLARTHAHS